MDIEETTEAEVTQESGQETQAQEQEITQEQPQAKEGAYAPPVDLSALDDSTRKAIEGRFAHLSHLMKKGDGRLSEWQRIAEEQSRRIEELTNGFTGVVNHLQDRSFGETETQLTQQMQTAWEAGDNASFIAAQNKLIDLKAEKKLTERERKTQPAPKPKQEQQRYANSAAEVAQENNLSPEDSQYVQSWQQETDESGNPLRPWAASRSPDPSKHDPDFIIANMQLEKITLEPRFANATVPQALAELDRRMGTTKAGTRQNVMGGNLTVSRKSPKIALNPKAEEIAVRMKLGGPKANREQHIQAYYKAQLEESKQKGAR